MLHELDLDALNVGHGLSENSKNFDYYKEYGIRNMEYGIRYNVKGRYKVYDDFIGQKTLKL